MRLAEIVSGVVANVIECDPDRIPDWAAGWIDAGAAGPGWTWDGSSFAPPAGPDPRPSATLDRAAFCKALHRLGVLPMDEAVIAARGGWPASFAAFTAALAPDAAADAQIDWAAATEIRYTAPLLQELALAHAGGDQAAATAILDAIFGIA